jgi:hypothetical protein
MSVVPETSPLHGALYPVVRQVAQVAAGYLIGAGILTESEATAIVGLVMSLATVGWMLAARAKAAPSGK